MATAIEEEKVKQRKPPKQGALANHASAQAQRRACANFARFEYGMSRGHREYTRQAQRNDRFYLGGGLQWDAEDVRERSSTNRRSPEQNEIKQLVDTAIGYQIANRMEIQVRPRGRGADDASAETFGKTIKFVADRTKLHWRETEVFTDGMIRQRGFYDIRMSFETNAYGTIAIGSVNPEDVIPDPDASSYDPDEWNDVTVRRWYTLDQIEQTYGIAARRAVELYSTADIASSEDEFGKRSGKFGQYEVGEWSLYMGDEDAASTTLYLVIDRQYRCFEPVKCAVYIDGDIRQIPWATPEQEEEYKRQGALITKRMQRRVKWLVTTRNCALFDDYSPYPWFTIVPFFPYFRHGMTRGLVDNAISIQESVNKGIADIGQALTTVANSGYTVQQGSLVDQTIDQFKKDAAKNGLVIHYKKGFDAPKRLDPPQMPTGMFEFVNMQVSALKNSTGMDETLTAAGPVGDQSGVAYQARQYAAQQKLAVPLDNLARTRHMLAQRIIDLIQMFMDAPQVLRIIETDPYGKEVTSELAVNQPIVDGDLVKWLNDLTVGEYDLVITEQPMQITFDNTQFEQLKALIDMGYTIPPEFAIRYTNLTDKGELAKAMAEASKAQPDPEVEAKVQLLIAQAQKTLAETVNKRIEAIYSATQAAAQVASIPQVASLGDEMLQSAGFEDQNAAPIIPEGGIGAGLAAAAPAAPTVTPVTQGTDPTDPSTNPLTPENPGVGLDAGIEAAGVQ